MSKTTLDRRGHAVAVVLALIWIAAGVGSICPGAAHAATQNPIVFGTIGAGYGMLWLRVVWTGRRIE